MKKGFTLTEVLIALSIIGVIAAMTIPNLMVSVGNSKTKTQLMKIMADLDQAVQLYEYNGGNWASALQSNTLIRQAFSSVMKINGGGTKAITSKYASGSTDGQLSGTQEYITLKNGMDIFFIYPNAACNNYGVNECNRIYIDIDGNGNGLDKQTNDVFIFSIVKEANGGYSIAPFGSNPSHLGYPVSSSIYRCSGIYGHACAAEILGGLDSQY
jgi:prepilin-type N-terminal cleavage/methylation domain-containing protein